MDWNNWKALSVVEALEEAIKGETGASRKYMAFMEQAEEEGFPNLARLFRAIAQAERIHIKNHSNVLGKAITIEEEEIVVGNSLKNVRAAFEGESWETREMYPAFRKIAKKTKGTLKPIADLARVSFEFARGAEKNHAKLFSWAAGILENGTDIPDVPIFLCRVCGNVEVDSKPNPCPVCDHSATFFWEVE